MKTKTLLISAAFSLFLTSFAQAQMGYESPYATDRNDKNYYNDPTRYLESTVPVHSDADVANPNPHVNVIGWDAHVPLRRFLNAIQEGVTNQHAVLKMFSAPNIMWRSPQTGKETWIYYWMWSYTDEEDVNKTMIQMDKPGYRVKKNKKPVSLVFVFNDQETVESYNIRLLKIKNDTFDDKYPATASAFAF